MKEKGTMRKFTLLLLVGMLVLLFSVPVHAATYKKSQSAVMGPGQCYHVMDLNIAKNRVTKYAVTVSAANSNTLYDIVFAKDGKEQAFKNTNKNLRIENRTGFYVKSNSSSNSGMLCCIKIYRGSVRLKVDYYTQNKSAALSLRKQSSQHKPLLGVAVPKGRQVLFRQLGSNVSTIPVVISSKQGAFTRRTLNSTTFENYTFMSSYMKYRYYKNGLLVSSKNLNVKYDSQSGETKYIQVLMPNRLSGWFATESGTITYYFPADYLNIAVSRK